MGYDTTFRGAIRVQPRVEPELAMKLNLFLSLRHSRLFRQSEFNRILTPIAKWEWQGLTPRIPNVDEARQDASAYWDCDVTLAPHLMEASSGFVTLEDRLSYQYILEHNLADGPSLYSKIWLVNDPEQNHSFLMWDGAEKAQNMDQWLDYTVRLLAFFGYQSDGAINAQGEEQSDRWCVITAGGYAERHAGHTKPTWTQEAKDALANSETASGVDIVREDSPW